MKKKVKQEIIRRQPLVIVIGAMALFFLVGCGGGGGGNNDDRGGEPTSPANIQGLWSVTEKVDATACGEGVYTTERTYSVSQTNSTISISILGHAFSGSVDGNRVSWSGSSTENGETFFMRFSGKVSGDAMSGTARWDWSDSASSCSGTTTITAVRQQAADASWKSEVVDSPGTWVSLALDASNVVHLAYDGKYATNAMGTWTIEDVSFKAEDSPMIFFWQRPTLAVDRQQTLHACFSLSTGIWHGTRDSGEWQLELVDEDGRDPKMAVDNQNAVHLVYSDAALSNLKYATNQTGDWVIEAIGTSHGGNATIAVDADGYAHIVYLASEPSYALMYVTNRSGQWIATQLNNQWFPDAMAIDDQSHIHIAAIGDGVHYLTNRSGSWEVETVSSSGMDCALAIDTQGRVHLVWTDSDAGYNSFLTHAIDVDGQWQKSILTQPATSSISAPWFALDSHDNGHLAYTCDNEVIYLTNGGD